jgi:hypothetical protein
MVVLEVWPNSRLTVCDEEMVVLPVAVFDQAEAPPALRARMRYFQVELGSSPESVCVCWSAAMVATVVQDSELAGARWISCEFGFAALSCQESARVVAVVVVTARLPGAAGGRGRVVAETGTVHAEGF